MRNTAVRLTFAAATALGLTFAPGREASAQEPQQPYRARELRGFDFAPDGVWRGKARRVREARAAAETRGDYAALNAPVQRGAPLPSALAVSGTLRTPVILFRFATTASVPGDSALYTSALFGTTPPLGRPYTIRTYYEQLSNGLFSMQGNAVGWVTLAGDQATYTGPATGCGSPFGTCNGIWNSAAQVAMQAGLREAVVRADSLVDFGQYDNDGPDGVPNSADDDGFVDLVIFVQPARDGACVAAGNNNLWAHRWVLNATGSYGVTTDPSARGGTVRVRDYTLQSGVGGDAACDESQLMAIGTAAHETGHGLGLPDFYDTNANDGDDSEGIGGWGLMGSGNYYYPSSPSTLEALSRKLVGWVTVRRLSASGVYTFGPSAVADTVFEVRPTGVNTRGEYFLLENRQAVQADTALINRKTGPGLLVWHVDSLQLAQGGALNSGPIHANWLLQADGLNQLRSSTVGVRNRGDAGDAFPGSTGNTALAAGTSPNNMLSTYVPSGFVLDSISQQAGGVMRFRLQFGGMLAVAASDTAAKVRVRGQTPVGLFRSFLLAGDTATVEIDSVQTSAAGTSRYTFVRWSDGGARRHVVTTASRDTALTATVTRHYDLRWTVVGPGSVVDTPTVNAAGSWVLEGDSVILRAQPGPNSLFLGWSGDVPSSETRLVIHAVQPHALIATFTAVAVDSIVTQLLAGHGVVNSHLVRLDYLGNRNGRFDLGDFVAWLDQTGTTVSAEVLARIFARVRE